MEEKDMDDDKAQLRWRHHRDVMLKVCKGKYEGARLPAYLVTSIRDLHQFPKLKALLAFSIFFYQNSRPFLLFLSSPITITRKPESARSRSL
jgi:hypothetical protein